MKRPMTLASFIPIDRRLALAEGRALPEIQHGAVLFADVSGFTPLTIALAEQYGSQRGAEEITRLLNTVYSGLIEQVHRYGGSVTSFAGDALFCWFADDSGERALTCALGMQAGLEALNRQSGDSRRLGIKIGIASGEIHRFVVGIPGIQRLDVMTGHPLVQVGVAEALADQGEIILCPATAAALAGQVILGSARPARSGQVFQHTLGQLRPARPQPWPEVELPWKEAAPWVLPAIAERFRRHQQRFISELRPVTSIFAQFGEIDYVGDPQAGEKLAAYLRWVQQNVHDYAGSLLQVLVGDKGSYVHIAFGAPQSHGDESGRALTAARILLHPPAALDFITTTRIGMTRGVCRAGAYGSDQRQTYGTLGAKINLAARLMTAAPVGEIRADFDLTRDAPNWQFDNLPPIRVKGQAGLIRVYRPLQAGPKDERNQRNADGVIGRAAELALLQTGIECLQNGQSGLVRIEGEAGIGKSTLVGGFIALAQAAGLSGLFGSGQSIEQNTPYRVWREILSGLLSLNEQQSPAERQRLAAQGVYSAAQEHMDRLPLLNDILPLQFPDNELTAYLPPELRRQNLHILVTALLAAWAEERPLPLIIEDAHWLDSASWELLLQVCRSLFQSRAPFYLLLAYRPLEPENLDRAYLTQIAELPAAHTTHLRLASLAPGEIAQLIARRLNAPPDQVPPALLALVQEKAGGNPFFAEELVTALAEQGVLRHGPDGALHLLSDPENLRKILPHTLQEVILARLDRLPPERLLALKMAAVIGRSFGFRLLHHVFSRYQTSSAAVLRQYLAGCSEENFITLETLEPDLTYLFRHIITQETAYEMLLYNQRRELHQDVAAWYEETFGRPDGNAVPDTLQPYLPLLVHHYRQAEQPARERRYAVLSARAAAGRYVHHETLVYLDRALMLSTAQDDLYELHDLREQAASRLGERAIQRAAIDQMLALATQRRNPALIATAILRRSRLALDTGANEDCQADCLQAGQVAAAHNLVHLQGEVATVLGTLALNQTNYPAAIAQLEKAIAIFSAHGWEDQVVAARNPLSTAYIWQGEYDQAYRLLEENLAACQQSNNLLGLAHTYHNLGTYFLYTADYTQAMIHYTTALEMRHRIGDRSGEVRTLNNIGLAHQYLGDNRQAMELYHQTARLAEEIDDPNLAATGLLNSGAVGSAMANFQTALDDYRRALEIYEKLRAPHSIAHVTGNIAALCYFWGRPAEAVTWARRATVEITPFHDNLITALAWVHLVYAHNDLGEFAAALQSADEFERLEAEGRVDPSFGPIVQVGRSYALYGLGELSAGRLLDRLPPAAALEKTDVHQFFSYLAVYDYLYTLHRAAASPEAAAYQDKARAVLQDTLAAMLDDETRRQFLHASPFARRLPV